MSKRIVFVRRGYLERKDFENFLYYVKKIAKYDPLRQEWIFSVDVAKNNVKNLEELIEILDVLSKYTLLTSEIKNEIIRLYKNAATKIILDVNNFSIAFGLGVDRSVVENLKDKLVYVGGKYIIKSIKYLPDIKKALKEKGYDLIYDENELKQSIEKRLIVVISRENSLLTVYFPEYIDVEVVKALKRACRLRYYEEKVILDQKGNYVDTEFIPREIDTFKISFKEKKATVYVGLIDRVLRILRENNYKIMLDLKEKPGLKIEFNPKFKLLPHQEDAFKLWIRKKRGTIAIFTRGGKSFVALKAILETKKPTIILVTTRELAYTWRKYLKEYLGISEAHIGYLGEGKKVIKPITIAIYNSAVKYLDKIKDKFELLIADEVHHVPAKTFKNIALQVDALYRLGLSATPKRRDGNHEFIYAIIGDLLLSIDYEELIKLRVVAPIEVYDAVFALGKEDKIKKLINILKKHENEKIFIFTIYLKTAEEIYETLLRAGFKAVLITGKTPSTKRKLAFKYFLNGKYNIVVTTTVLDEGITVPGAEVAIIYENSGEARQLIQRIGRILNYRPGKTAKIYEIIDVKNPREKYSYYKRRWVRDFYIFDGMEKYVYDEKHAKERGEYSSFSYQSKLTF